MKIFSQIHAMVDSKGSFCQIPTPTPTQTFDYMQMR